jgi:hypothetical protein
VGRDNYSFKKRKREIAKKKKKEAKLQRKIERKNIQQAENVEGAANEDKALNTEINAEPVKGQI